MMWFRYERDFARRWIPVVYHVDKPKQVDGDRQTAAVDVPAGCIGEDGAPMFGRIIDRFPPPVEAE